MPRNPGAMMAENLETVLLRFQGDMAALGYGPKMTLTLKTKREGMQITSELAARYQFAAPGEQRSPIDIADWEQIMFGHLTIRWPRVLEVRREAVVQNYSV